MIAAALMSILWAVAPAAPAGPSASSGEWSPAQAAHLLRRAGFGGTPEQIAYLTKLGREKAVDEILEYDRVQDEPIPLKLMPYVPPPRFTHPDAGPQELAKLRNLLLMQDGAQLRQVVRWWIETMVSSPRPFQERMVLYWHGHFTSGQREVRSSRALYFQNQLFRSRACGNFRELLIAITYDPAMGRYLNITENRKGSPNENYARELMELFTLGPGHYSEQDIKEAARAMTGLTIDPSTGEMIFLRRRHDDGEKTFMGRTGRFGPEEIIDIILAQPEAAEFLAGKLWSYFAYESPDEKTIKNLAEVLRKNDYELKPFFRAMFLSDAFYGERAMFTKIKSPVDLLVGTLRVLEIKPLDTEAMRNGLERMGQQLMQPPNVKGWDGGLTWITTSTLYNRYNVIGSLLVGNDNAVGRRLRERMRERIEQFREMLPEEMAGTGMTDEELLPPLQPAFDPILIVREAKLTKAEQIVDYFIDRLLQRPIPPARRKVLVEMLRETIDTNNVQKTTNAVGIRSLIHVITSMPEYQLE